MMLRFLLPCFLVVASQSYECLNGGKLRGGICDCPLEFAGTQCQLPTHCYGFQRRANGTCLSCQEHYTGTKCEQIVCTHGTSSIEQDCECDAPWSGQFCDELKTEDVYLFYNRKMMQYGPLGAVAIIPMVIMMYGCRYKSKKRLVKRVEESFEAQHETDIDPSAVAQLLNS